MERKWRIRREFRGSLSPYNGITYDSISKVSELVDMLNRDYPDVVHTVEEVPQSGDEGDKMTENFYAEPFPSGVPALSTSEIRAAVDKVRREKTAYLIGTHKYSFRYNEPAEIIGVKFVCPGENYAERLCYLIKYSDGFLDYVVVEDRKNYKIVGDINNL